MRFITIIPARYGSTRFPGKALAMLDGKPLVQWVYERVNGITDLTVVATDDERIASVASDFGATVVMTGTHHHNGTERCHEAATRIGGSHDVVINVQGDEPFVHPAQIEALMQCFEQDADTQIATLVQPFAATATMEELENPNACKVVLNVQMEAMCFSRSVIPYIRNHERTLWPQNHTYYKHVGIYAYRTDVLHRIVHLQPTPLEVAESLEQMRWLQNGFRIKVAITQHGNMGIDTPEDLIEAERYLKNLKKA